MRHEKKIRPSAALIYQQLGASDFATLASALSDVWLPNEQDHIFDELNDFYSSEIIEPTKNRYMTRIKQIKHSLLRRVWKPSGSMYSIDSDIDTTVPMLRTMLRTRRFEEELMQNVWKPGGGMMNYFLIDDEI